MKRKIIIDNEERKRKIILNDEEHKDNKYEIEKEIACDRYINLNDEIKKKKE